MTWVIGIICYFILLFFVLKMFSWIKECDSDIKKMEKEMEEE